MFEKKAKIIGYFLGILIMAQFFILFPASRAMATGGLTYDNLMGDPTIGNELGLQTQDVRVTIARIIRVAMGLIGIVMVAGIIYGGFLYMTAGGNEDQAGTGKKAIVAGVIGLAIILSAWSLTNFIINSLLTATAP